MKNLVRVYRQVVAILPPGARRYLRRYMATTSALSLLDVAALGLLAGILSPMISGRSVTLPLIGTVEQSGYIWVLALVCLLIVIKGVLALAIQWVATRRFAEYELAVGDLLFAAYVRAPWTDRLQRSTPELVRLADVGIANTMSGVILPAATIPTQIATFLSVLLVLVIAQPVTAAITLGYLALIAAFLYFGISRQSVLAGQVNLRYSQRVAKLMSEIVSALKEVTLRGAFTEVAAIVHDTRERSTTARANLQFLGTFPRYVVEAALVGGFALVGGVAYAGGGVTEAFSAVALFGVAGFRMMPSITGFQGVMTRTAGALPHAEAVLRDVHAAEHYRAHAENVGNEPFAHEPRELVLRDVSFTYPGADEPALRNVDLDIPIGSSLALVGSSGAGKSTLVDLLLGLLSPSDGSIELDGVALERVLAAWRSRVGYVPQDVALFDGTIAQNVALTWSDDLDEQRVRAALDRAQLTPTVTARPGGLHARIGERGIAMSGGQRQRLGIARALYNNPLVLVLDEATSALDTTTEDAVSRAIQDLHGDVTVISVAHRLSTIRDSDQICFMRDAEIVDRGTFDQLVDSQPDFAVQAHLAGLV